MPIKIYGPKAASHRLLRIKVLHAKDLIKDYFGSCNPYVNVALHKKNDDITVIDSTRTASVKKNTNPFFNEDFIFSVNTQEHKLIIDVFNETKKSNHEFLGRVVIPLDGSRIIISDEFSPNSRNSIDFNLEKKTFLSKVRGKLTLILNYVQSEESLNAESVGILPVPTLSVHSSTPAQSVAASAGAPVAPSAPSPTTPTSTSNGLPEGWEQRVDQNGRIYFIDHNTRRTTWVRPQINQRAHSTSSSSNNTPTSTNPNNTDTTSTTTATLTPNTNTMTRHHISDENGTSQSNGDTSSSGTTSVQSGLSSSRVGSASSNSKTDEPIPQGWEISYTDKGRMFFIDHNTKQTSWIDPRTGKPSPQPALDFEKRIGPLPSGWEERRHHDGRIFYIDHVNKKTQWEDPRLEKFSGPAVPYSRDYKHKYETFKKMLPASPSKQSQFGGTEKYPIRVRRANILEDAYNKIMSEKNAELLRMQLWIEFDGEKSYDYGGVSREFFHCLSKEIFNPYYGLFEYSAIDNYTLQINPNSSLVNEHHLDYYYFIGRVVAMAVYHNRLLDGFFIRPFYKMMLHKSIVLQDIEAVDAEYYKSLVYIMETDDVDSLDLTFTIESDIYGQKVEYELKTGGKDLKVTKENRKEYVDLVIQWKFVKRIERQMSQFTKGFYEIIPLRCMSIFDPKELELLISGLGDVNIKDWQANTLFKGEYHSQHRVIQWFWMAMYSFPNELRLRFLQFVTGTSRVPMNGFAELQGSNGYQKFTIQSWGEYKQLPRAHTCFNRLDLPPYRSYEELREKILLAVENSEGFDGVD